MITGNEFFNAVVPLILGDSTVKHQGESAYIECPGVMEHEEITSWNDTTVEWNHGHPSVQCKHPSCRAVRRVVNDLLRKLSQEAEVKLSGNPPASTLKVVHEISPSGLGYNSKGKNI